MPQFQSRTQLDPKYGAEGNRANLEDTFAMMNKVIQQAQGPVNIPFPKGTLTLGGQQLVESAGQHASALALEQERENRLRQQGMMQGGGSSTPSMSDMRSIWTQSAFAGAGSMWNGWLSKNKVQGIPDPEQAEKAISELMPQIRMGAYSDAASYGFSTDEAEALSRSIEQYFRAMSQMDTYTTEEQKILWKDSLQGPANDWGAILDSGGSASGILDALRKGQPVR